MNKVELSYEKFRAHKRTCPALTLAMPSLNCMRELYTPVATDGGEKDLEIMLQSENECIFLVSGESW